MTDIVQNFDQSVEGYETHSAPQAALAAALASWIPLEERNGYAVEFGAGTGLFTRRMQPWCGPYLATDAAPRMVASGIERCPYVAWKAHEARAPQGLGPANWVLACNLLQWLENPAEILSAWRGILKPGGHLAVAVLVKGTMEELAQVLPEAHTLPWRPTAEWGQLVKEAGFAVERAETWRHVEVYPDALNFLRSVHDMGLAPNRQIGPGRLRTALRAYDRQFSITGGVRATWQAWLARARIA